MKSLKLLFLAILIPVFALGQNNKKIAVIAYYMGDDKQINEFDSSKLTHIIFSFCHLKEGKLSVDSAKDSLTIKKLVSLKGKNPDLKIMLSLGGWGGCEPCSAVFASAEKRAIFAKSVKDINTYFKTDGLDLDWEYPAIEGYPGHLYQKADRENFTALVVLLRKELGTKNELSFAAGGFQKYLDEAIEWKKVMPLVDRVNIMSYDLVNGFSKVTGHHTPLFSANAADESTNRAVEYLLKLGIPSSKLVIGAAFYTRVWKEVANVNNGLYQSGEAENGIDFKDFETAFTKEKGWNYYWDDKAKAPYWYNEKEKLFATGDDIASVKEKTNYVIQKKLGGIMFWELTLDKKQNGLVDVINEIKNSK
ncbi:glycoside hydrolase family 18 protein [Flavobacterium aquicola]|uniref:chitinase n=1 Tax=Flavobacterium aquicola TaxID=1682742 RepID=A0A3E0EPA6_9FLAO|nr:glycoside hydrolase family 18 protein [Flavobacterium aquicola]REG99573.1 chitinase [Flavobacterium aquicola]